MPGGHCFMCKSEGSVVNIYNQSLLIDCVIKKGNLNQLYLQNATQLVFRKCSSKEQDQDT